MVPGVGGRWLSGTYTYQEQSCKRNSRAPLGSDAGYAQIVCWPSTGLFTQLAVLLAGCRTWEGCRWPVKTQPSRDSAFSMSNSVSLFRLLDDYHKQRHKTDLSEKLT